MKISKSMREVLLDHMDGQSIPVVVSNPKRRHRAVPGGGGHGSLTVATRVHVLHSALRRGYLRYEEPTVRRTTVITEIGRGALAEALAEWADALIRAGLDLNAPSPDLPIRLALLRKWATGSRFMAASQAVGG